MCIAGHVAVHHYVITAEFAQKLFESLPDDAEVNFATHIWMRNQRRHFRNHAVLPQFSPIGQVFGNRMYEVIKILHR